MTLDVNLQTYTKKSATPLTFTEQAATTSTYSDQAAPSVNFNIADTGDVSYTQQTASTITYDSIDRADGSLYGEGDYSFWYYAARLFYLGRSV